jgi:hypothetical protein
MAKQITISVPHHLTQDEARRRIAAGVETALASKATNVAKVEQTWTGNRLDFRVTVFGQTAGGHLDVQPTDVNVVIDLPWLFASFADRIRTQVTEQGAKLLENK